MKKKPKKQKTFSDLKFRRTRDPDPQDKRAVMKFDNGWGVSVLTGKSHYSSGSGSYEVAVTKEGSIVHEGDSTGVYGWLPVYCVTQVMRDVQERK